MIKELKRYIKNIGMFIIDLLTLPINYLLRIDWIRPQVVYGLYRRKANDKRLIQYSIMDKKNKVLPIYKEMGNKYGIVVQGPIDYKNDFTYNMLLYYRSIYPNVIIVLSTSDLEIDQKFKNNIDKIDVVLQHNVIKENPGYGNVNYQLRNTLFGIRILKKYNVEYVLKTRSDQLINKPGFLKYFENLLTAIPCGYTCMEKRLVLLGDRNTFKWIPFHVSDFLTFGSIKDMERLYSSISDYKGKKPSSFSILDKLRNKLSKHEFMPVNDNWPGLKRWNHIMSKYTNPEIFIMREFYNRYICKLKNHTLLQQYWSFVKNGTIIVDADDINLYWDKYEMQYVRTSIFDFATGNLDHEAWLDIYLNHEEDTVISDEHKS